jgi:hypothetical protein
VYLGLWVGGFGYDFVGSHFNPCMVRALDRLAGWLVYFFFSIPGDGRCQAARIFSRLAGWLVYFFLLSAYHHHHHHPFAALSLWPLFEVPH